MRSDWRSAVVSLAGIVVLAAGARADALAKLQPDKLEAVHRAIAALRARRHEAPRTGPYVEYRANIHVHSALSHDSRGKIEDILTAAKTAGTRVLMFTEHPSERADYFTQGHQGTKDGVLMIPGAETRGFLIFPTQSLRGLESGTPQEFCDLVRSRGGLVFLSHLEERMDWEIRGMTGTEIYNTHADFKDEKNLMIAMRNPAWIFKTADLIARYPQEAFSSVLDYPADYLRRWDQLCRKAPLTGVAANDSHQNVGLAVRLITPDKVRLEDALGQKLMELPAGLFPALQPMRAGKKVGDVIFRVRLDPYEYSLRHAGTHLLLSDFSRQGVWEALEAGRAFVAFDWLADATGFDFAAVDGARRFEMGSRIPLADGLKLQARAPLPVKWRLIRNGNVALEHEHPTLDFPVTDPGNYRVEAWLKVAGEDTIWILSNPVYIRAR